MDPGNRDFSNQMHPETSQAVVALVLVILSLILCQLLGPFAWNTANNEIRGIEGGLRDPANLSSANLARILGIVGTVLLGAEMLGSLFWLYSRWT